MRLRQIQDRLEENGAAIGRIEAFIAKHPVESASLRPMLEVLEKMKKKIEAEWLDVADQGGVQSKFSSFSVNRMRALRFFMRVIREGLGQASRFYAMKDEFTVNPRHGDHKSREEKQFRQVIQFMRCDLSNLASDIKCYLEIGRAGITDKEIEEDRKIKGNYKVYLTNLSSPVDYFYDEESTRTIPPRKTFPS